MSNVLKHTTINGFLISTTKLSKFGLDTQNWTQHIDSGRGDYETMVFREEKDGDINWTDLHCDRTSDLAIAMKQHKIACDKVRNGDIK